MFNKKHPTIKLTAEWPTKQTNFLELTVSLENRKTNRPLC